MIIYLNGEYVPKEHAVVSVFDHGLLYGDGVFEGIRAYHGRVFKLSEHLTGFMILPDRCYGDSLNKG